jgi:hypothetical protein
MRKSLLILGLFLFSCNNPEESIISPIEVDSVLIKSQQNLVTSDSVQKKSDSTTKEQVIKVIREFKILTNEVEKFKTERLLLEKTMNVVSQKIVTRVDTVFIEVEKNFWGKKKTKTTVSSDSIISEISDSNSVSNEVIDTLLLPRKIVLLN